MTKFARHYRSVLIMLVLVVSVLMMAACGRSESSDTTSASAAPPTPTRPFGQFTAVGEQSILTGTTSVTETAETTQTAQTDAAAPDLTRGEAAYVKNKCGDCHGASGEGVADKGKALTTVELTLEDFDNVLRTGGGLGNEHIFGRSAISPSGMEALYAYVQSLGQ